MENVIFLTEKICSFGERQGIQLRRTVKFIKSILSQNKISFNVLEYNVKVPLFKKFELVADNQQIECLPSGLKSGYVTKKNIISNLLEENIFFGKVCARSGGLKPYQEKCCNRKAGGDRTSPVPGIYRVVTSSRRTSRKSSSP